MSSMWILSHNERQGLLNNIQRCHSYATKQTRVRTSLSLVNQIILHVSPTIASRGVNQLLLFFFFCITTLYPNNLFFMTACHACTAKVCFQQDLEYMWIKKKKKYFFVHVYHHVFWTIVEQLIHHTSTSSSHANLRWLFPSLNYILAWRTFLIEFK